MEQKKPATSRSDSDPRMISQQRRRYSGAADAPRALAGGSPSGPRDLRLDPRFSPRPLEPLPPRPTSENGQIESSGSRAIPRLGDDEDFDDEDCATPRPQVSPFVVPRILMDKSEIIELPLDHRAGYILALVDGKTNVQTIIDIAGMDEAEVKNMLESLLLFGVLSFDAR